MSGEPRAPDERHRRWPRRRSLLRSRSLLPRRSLVRRHLDPEVRWDPDRGGEDAPSLLATVLLTALGAVALAGMWLLDPLAAGAVYGALLLASLGVEVIGAALSTRVRGPVHRAVWTLVRPAYAVGLALWGVVEAVVALLA